MKATELLKEQHAEVRSLFERLLKGNGESKELLKKLATSLSAHMAIEQELFYPAVLKVKEDLVLEGYEEHAVARFALKRLMKTSPSDQTFKAKVTTLMEIIEHHVEEEEEDMFPASEKALGDGSTALSKKMKELFDATAKGGYESAVGPRGPAIRSAKAPSLDHG